MQSQSSDRSGTGKPVAGGVNDANENAAWGSQVHCETRMRNTR